MWTSLSTLGQVGFKRTSLQVVPAVVRPDPLGMVHRTTTMTIASGLVGLLNRYGRSYNRILHVTRRAGLVYA